MFFKHSFSSFFSTIVYCIICTLLFTSTFADAARPRGNVNVRRQTPAADKPCDGFFNIDYDFYLASDVYKCLISVPFNQTAALQIVQYYEQTIQLQSTLAYLKNPPAGYKQPKYDFVGGLASIKSQVNAGKFKNEYEFELALQKAVLATHDAHINLIYGILSIWVFASPYGLVAASKDGIELPKIYITDDLIESNLPGANFKPSPITTIDGKAANAYLEQFASEQVGGFIEPHADWNALMSSAAGDIQNIYSVFEGNAPFYPGSNITFKFANGTTTDDDDGTKLPWFAQFSPYVDSSSTPNITTGQQLFDWFVLGIDSTPEAATSSQTTTNTTDVAATNTTLSQSNTTDSTTSEANTQAWNNDAYPDADTIVSQPDLGESGAYVTGYILNDDVTGILSIPSFDATADSAVTFSAAVRDFLNYTKDNGVKQVIIDLQRNGGGSDLLATDTFKQFFPQLDPFSAVRGRAEATGNVIGNTFSSFYQSKQPSEFTDPSYEELSADIWTAPAAINVETNANFTNWQQYFGPIPYNGDQFTRLRKDNLSSSVFTEAVANIVVYGFANSTVNTTQPYPAKDVILLTDGICSSACARFVELMHTIGGARTVVVGGRPEAGAQQAVAGNKGALQYDSFALEDDISTATTLNESVTAALPSRPNVDFILTYASFNIFDNLRRGTTIPLQFQYEPADCRIFYTTWTVYNYENLWNYVIDALYRNPSLCVSGGSTTIQSPPSSVGNLIVAGLSPNNPPSKGATPPSRKRKRSTPIPLPLKSQPLTPRSLSPRSPNLETDRDAITVASGACDQCGSQSECIRVPDCSGGGSKSSQICARICTGDISCPGGGRTYFCTPNLSTTTRNQLCASVKQRDAIRQCGTKGSAPPGGQDPQSTQPLNLVGGNNLQYSARQQQQSGTTKAGGRSSKKKRN